MSDKIGCFIIDIAGTALTAEDKDLLAHPLVGGIILFARNYKSRQQLIELCATIRQCRPSRLLIMVDQEGGRVQRFRDDFTILPPMAQFGGLYDQDPRRACALARDGGWLMATELLTAGVDLSFAPVLDLRNDFNKAIGDRAIHHHSHAVIQLANAYIEGMHTAGMAATGKHFPGHGSVDVDSHVALPVDKRSLEEIANTDMVPFAALIKSGIDAIMAAHIIYPQVDKYPVGFSRHWLKDILRGRFGFKGVIVSDDLNMEGANISANYADRVEAARAAGCDITLLCNNRTGVIQVLDQLKPESHLLDKAKWQVLAGDISRVNEDFANEKNWQHIQQQLQTLGNQTHYERNIGK